MTDDVLAVLEGRSPKVGDVVVLTRRLHRYANSWPAGTVCRVEFVDLHAPGVMPSVGARRIRPNRPTVARLPPGCYVFEEGED